MRIRAVLGSVLLASLALPLIAFGADSGQRNAVLSGANEVPAVSTAAKGSGWVTLSADDSTITFHLEYSGLSGAATAAHIHTGAAGVNGGVIFPFVVGPSPINGTFTAANFTPSGAITTYAQAIAAIKAGNTYMNVHTAANPGGEIRGQIQPLPPATSTESPASGASIGQIALILGGSFLILAAGVAWRIQRRTR
jgi:hypothetical protein